MTADLLFGCVRGCFGSDYLWYVVSDCVGCWFIVAVCGGVGCLFVLCVLFCSWACVVSLACGFVVLFCYLIVLLVLVAVGLVGLLVSLLIAARVLFWVLMLDYCWLV